MSSYPGMTGNGEHKVASETAPVDRQVKSAVFAPCSGLHKLKQTMTLTISKSSKLSKIEQNVIFLRTFPMNGF